jgi:hypothetical protein
MTKQSTGLHQDHASERRINLAGIILAAGAVLALV